MPQKKAVELMLHLEALARQFLLRDRDKPRGEFPLSRQEVRALSTIGGIGICSMGKLAAELGVSGSALTALIDRLDEKKLVSRKLAQTDRRLVLVDLTREGRKRFERRRRKRLLMAKAMITALDRNRQEELLTLMRIITAKALGVDGAEMMRRLRAATGKGDKN